MEKCLIVAVADDGAIGSQGQLPWHISEDLKFFKRSTMGCPVIMGRATFQSLSKPLPGRLNIVLSSTLPTFDGIKIASSLGEAIGLASDSGAERCFVIGGAKVYSQALEIVDKVFITRVHTTVPAADAFFPDLSSQSWELVSRSETFEDTQSNIRFEFEEYMRR